MASNDTMSSAAKVGIAIAAAVGVVSLFSLGLWLWWRRRQKRQMANDMVNFVDGDIVNLVDQGRFEKPSKPVGAYDPYYNGSSSHSTTPSPVYYQPPFNFTTPPVENHTEYYAPVGSQQPPTASVWAPSLPPSRDAYLPSEPRHAIQPNEPIPPLPRPVTTTENQSWANTSRHPWSPPDYDAHAPLSASSLQPESNFFAVSRNHQPINNDDDGDSKATYPVTALPAILPEPRHEPQAELPTRDGPHGWGHEQELPAPHQAPLQRHGPPHGNEVDEQKFLLSDMVLIRQQKTGQATSSRPAG